MDVEIVHFLVALLFLRGLGSIAFILTTHFDGGDVEMQASGGSMMAEDARGRAVNIVNSGPAGGTLAAAYVGQLTGNEGVIGMDMGGTSFDIGLIVGGEPRVAPESQFEGFSVKVPILDVHAIGAGGGSLAWVDQGGALNVGPESAGSAPGPACYGLGEEIIAFMCRMGGDIGWGKFSLVELDEANKRLIIEAVDKTGQWGQIAML
jgi:N-methylhydantoinase A/oxoprolinase/acetone carboxylase beta subunit